MLILHFHDPHHRIHLHEPSRLVTLSDIPTDSSNKDLIYSHPCPIVFTLLFYNPYHHVSPSTLSRAPMSSPPRSIFSTWSLCYIIPRFVLFCPAYACPSTTHTVVSPNIDASPRTSWLVTLSAMSSAPTTITPKFAFPQTLSTNIHQSNLASPSGFLQLPIITHYTFSILSSPPRTIFSAFLRDIPCFIPSNLTLPPFRSFLRSLPSSPYPITDQGGIATPQSVNCSLVHDPPKNLKKTREPRLHTT